MNRQDAAFLPLAHDHLRWRTPVRPFALQCDVRRAVPLETCLADADAVAHRLAVSQYVIEKLRPGIDNDGAGQLVGTIIRDDLAKVFAVDLVDRNRRNAISGIAHAAVVSGEGSEGPAGGTAGECGRHSKPCPNQDRFRAHESSRQSQLWFAR